jgi:hypothetical protein
MTASRGVQHADVLVETFSLCAAVSQFLARVKGGTARAKPWQGALQPPLYLYACDPASTEWLSVAGGGARNHDYDLQYPFPYKMLSWLPRLGAEVIAVQNDGVDEDRQAPHSTWSARIVPAQRLISTA